MSTEKFSQHFPWPQNTNVYLHVPGLNYTRIYGKKRKRKASSGLKAGNDSYLDRKMWRADEHYSAVLKSKRHFELQGWNVCEASSESSDQRTWCIVSAPSVSATSPCAGSCCSSFPSQDSTRPNRWFTSSAVFLTVKLSPHWPPWKQHLSSCRRTGLWRRVRGSLLEWKGICGMIFCSRHQ